MRKIKERLTKEDWKQIEILKNEKGYSMSRISREYKVTFVTIWRYFKKNKKKSSWKLWK